MAQNRISVLSIILLISRVHSTCIMLALYAPSCLEYPPFYACTVSCDFRHKAHRSMHVLQLMCKNSWNTGKEAAAGYSRNIAVLLHGRCNLQAHLLQHWLPADILFWWLLGILVDRELRTWREFLPPGAIHFKRVMTWWVAFLHVRYQVSCEHSILLWGECDVGVWHHHLE